MIPDLVTLSAFASNEEPKALQDRRSLRQSRGDLPHERGYIPHVLARDMEDAPAGSIQLTQTGAVAMKLTRVSMPLPVILDAESECRPGKVETRHEESVYEHVELRNGHRQPGPQHLDPQS